MLLHSTKSPKQGRAHRAFSLRLANTFHVKSRVPVFTVPSDSRVPILPCPIFVQPEPLEEPPSSSNCHADREGVRKPRATGAITQLAVCLLGKPEFSLQKRCKISWVWWCVLSPQRWGDRGGQSPGQPSPVSSLAANETLGNSEVAVLEEWHLRLTSDLYMCVHT